MDEAARQIFGIAISMRLLRGRHLGDCDHEVCEVVLADAALHCRGGPGLILIAPLLPPGAQSSSPLPLSCPTSPFRCPCCTPLLPSCHSLRCSSWSSQRPRPPQVHRA